MTWARIGHRLAQQFANGFLGVAWSGHGGLAIGDEAVEVKHDFVSPWGSGGGEIYP